MPGHPVSSAPREPGPRHVPRRRLLALLSGGAGAVLGASLVGACGPSASSTASPTPSPTPGQTGGLTSAPAPGTPAAPAVGQPSETGPVKIGVLLPFTQVYAQLGQDVLDGMQLYFESVSNQAGGRALRIIREDEGVDAAPAVQKVRKLIEQDTVDVFTGIVATPIAYGARDLLHNARLPSIISTAGGNDLTRGRKSPYIFRTSYSAWQIAFPLGEYVAQNISKKVVISAADYAFGRECAAAFKENYEQNGGQVLKEIFPKFPNTDYAPYLADIRSANPEATYNFYAGSDAVNFVKQYAEFGLKKTIRLTGSGPLLEEDTFPAQGEAALGGISTLHWAKTLDNPENQRFLAGWATRYRRDPSVYAVHGYDSARVIVDALTAASGRTTDRDALAKAIGGVQFASPRGAFAFDPATNNVINPMYVREVRLLDGRPTNVVIATLPPQRDPG